MIEHRLSSHVRIAVDQDIAVLLDLRRDAYFSLPAEKAVALGIAPGPYGENNAPQELIEAMIRRRLLSGVGRARDTQANWMSCLWTCLWAERVLRTRQLEHLEYMLRSRYISARHKRGIVADVDTANARFERLRPIYPKARVCLFDSIALMHWLTGQAIAVDLIVGVRVRPFGAHAWVEYQSKPLNDFAGQAESYREIWRISV